MTYDKKLSDPKRFRATVSKNEEKGITATIMQGLCKGCGNCVAKCPVKCISWDKESIGATGEPVITIDMETCIGCETCEAICPDFAVEITKETPKKE